MSPLASRLIAAVERANEQARVKIVTHYDPKPIPPRQFDWVATTDDYDGPGSPIGYGATRGEAIDDLREQIEERS